jgi:cytoskeletal protein CcmA (bactofilin family)
MAKFFKSNRRRNRGADRRAEARPGPTPPQGATPASKESTVPKAAPVLRDSPPAVPAPEPPKVENVPAESKGVGAINGSTHKEAYMSAERSQTINGAHATTIGKGSQITGNLSFEGTVMIEGKVEGEIAAQESVIVGETAVVQAQVTADSVVVTGNVTGDITARRRVEIRAPGKLFGNITTPSLIIHDGVVFEGHCSMGGDQAAAKTDKTVPLFPQGDDGKQAATGGLKAQSEGEW